MSFKRSITFFPEKRKINGKLKSDNVPIRIRISFNGSYVETSTGVRIDLKDWDSKAKKVIKDSLSYSDDKRALLLALETAIQRIFKLGELNNQFPTKNDILKSIKSIKQPGYSDKKQDHKIIALITEFSFSEARLNSWSKGTSTKFNTVKKNWELFNKNQTISEFNNKIFADYVYFLQKEKKYGNVTLEKHIKYMKWFLRWCHKNKYLSTLAFLEFKPTIKKAKKKIIFLTFDEQQRIYNCKIPESKQYLERARDILKFMCFSGLRISDVQNLRRSDIKENHIEITTKKTHDSLIIELNKHTKEVLEKYKDFRYSNNCPLPIISSQKFNTYLKELGKRANLTEEITITTYSGNSRNDKVYKKHQLLSSHIGRRSFICTALILGIPPHVVMKWSGHSDYKSMQPYIDVADKHKIQYMQKFDAL